MVAKWQSGRKSILFNGMKGIFCRLTCDQQWSELHEPLVRMETWPPYQWVQFAHTGRQLWPDVWLCQIAWWRKIVKWGPDHELLSQVQQLHILSTWYSMQWCQSRLGSLHAGLNRAPSCEAIQEKKHDSELHWSSSLRQKFNVIQLHDTIFIVSWRIPIQLDCAPLYNFFHYLNTSDSNQVEKRLSLRRIPHYSR